MNWLKKYWGKTMHARKFFQLKSITVGNKKMYPIALLKIIIIKDTFFSIDYEISAFKIIENKKVYFKNINLSQKDFDTVSKSFQYVNEESCLK